MTDGDAAASGIQRHDDLALLAPEQFGSPAVTVGMFDGMHRGHQHVIQHLRVLADRIRGAAVVVTFATHPLAIIRGQAPRQICSTNHRVTLLERAGIDHVVVLPFDNTFRHMPYDRFIREVLIDRIGMRGLLFGYDSSFGYRGEGKPATVGPLAAELGFEIVEAPAITIDGAAISSSRVRDAIAAGDLDEVAHLLGRPHTLSGPVVRGDGRGRTIGFPTANVDLEGAMTPPPGVYQVIVLLRGQRRVAVANLGTRPTVDPDRTVPVLEVYIPGIDFSFYGERLDVEFVRKIRDEQKFPSVSALVEQIEKDVASLGLG